MKQWAVPPVLITFLLIVTPASSEEFNHNQQSNNNRFSGSCPKCQGYDPFASILNQTNLDFFIHKGPGAVTDNMFGIVSGTDLGSDNGVGGVGAAADTDTKFCGPTGNGGPNFPVGSKLGGNNCGNLRIDPMTQGQFIPGGNNTTTDLHEWMTFSGDFFPSTDSHNGFEVTLDFNWSCRTVSGSGPPPPPICNTVIQRIKQDTLTLPASEGGGAGVLTPSSGLPCAPTLTVNTTGAGVGEAIMTEDTCFSVNRFADGNLNPTNPVIQWSEQVHEPVFFSQGPDKFFEYSVSGFFYYNDPNTDLNGQPLSQFPVSTYPTGISQTERSKTPCAVPPLGSETIFSGTSPAAENPC